MKDEILSALGDAFAEIVHYDLVYDLRTEIFNKARLEAGGITLEDKPKEAPAREEEGESSALGALGTVQVLCRPVLDPVHGKAVSDLKRGDIVMVGLEKTGGVSAIISKVFERSGDTPAFPVLSVERLPSGQLLVKLHISTGIEGVLRAGTDLKLKTGGTASGRHRERTRLSRSERCLREQRSFCCSPLSSISSSDGRGCLFGPESLGCRTLG